MSIIPLLIQKKKLLGANVNPFDSLAPSDLALTVLSDTSIKLDWTNNSINAEGVSIERSTDGVAYTEIDTVTASTATYTDATVTDGTRYYYRLKAYKGAVSSAASTAANIYTWLYATLTTTGTGAGVSTLRMEVSETQILEITSGTARFYTDAAGTAGESTTWEIASGAMRTIYLKAPTATSTLKIINPEKVIKWGTIGTDGWISSTNAANIAIEVGKLALTNLRIAGAATFAGTLPQTLTYLYFASDLINWTFTQALPTGLTYIYLAGALLSWTYSGALSTGLTYIRLNGNLIDWTGLDIGNDGNIDPVNLLNYRINKMSSADMVTLLTQMTNRTGTLSATITINDYADYASPPQEVVDAVALLKSTKSITTVNLGA